MGIPRRTVMVIVWVAIAVSVYATDIKLAWDAAQPVGQVGKYIVYRAPVEEGPFVKIGEVLVPGYTDAGTLPGVKCYRVTAVDNFWGLETAPSNTVCVPAPITTPGALTVTVTIQVGT